MPHFAYYNGEIKSRDDVRIDPYDLGLLRGYALFDYGRTHHGKVFLPDWYWQRVAHGAQRMGLPFTLSAAEFTDIYTTLHVKSGYDNVAFRLLLTGGNAPDSINAMTPQLLIMTEDAPPAPETAFPKGLAVKTHDYLRPLPDVKTTNYLELMRLLPNLKQQGFDDVLYIHDNHVLELSRSNLFMIKDNILVTPADNILKGITRRLVLELAQDICGVEERVVTLTELHNADAVFTTSTNKLITPIARIDDYKFDNENCVFLQLKSKLLNFLANY